MTDVLPDGWAWATLGELASRCPNAITDGPFGSKLKSEHYVLSGVRVVRLGNIGIGQFCDEDRAFIDETCFEALRKHRIFPGDLLIAALAEPVGRCCQVPANLAKAIVKADCIRFVPHEALDRKYVMHWLNSPVGRHQSEQTAHGVGRLRMNLEEIKSLQIPVAPSAEQLRIVAKIEDLIARSQAARAALADVPALLEQYRQSVLAAAFRGDLTADWRAKHPNAEPASALLDRIRAERRRQWEAKYPKKKYVAPEPVDESELPTLPEGWCCATIDLFAFVTKLAGFEYTKYVEYDPAGDLAVIKAENAGPNGFRKTEYSRVKSESVAQLTRTMLRAGDLLMVFVGAGVGNVAAVPDDRRYFLGPNIAMIRVESAHVDPLYLELYLRSPLGFDIAMSFTKAVAQPSLSMGTIRQIAVPIPPLNEQKEIRRQLLNCLNRCTAVDQSVKLQVSEIDQLEMSILAKAFRGDLVSQDSNDEPASTMLERIKAESTLFDGSPRGRAKARARR